MMKEMINNSAVSPLPLRLEIPSSYMPAPYAVVNGGLISWYSMGRMAPNH